MNKDKFAILRIKNKSIDLANYPFWIKEKLSQGFIMVYMNHACESMFYKPNGFNKYDAYGKSDLDIWGEELAAKYMKGDEETLKNKNKNEETLEYIIDGKTLKKKFIKQYIEDIVTKKVYIVGICIDI